MTTTTDDWRPYASPSNVIAVIARARSRNLPEHITNDFLRLSDVPQLVFNRVMRTLHFLGLVTDDGRPSDVLRAISAATEAQYREFLNAALRAAYADDFERVDPSQDSQAKIQDAFRPYQPRSQTQRMVILFLGLCREAGIPVLEAPRDRKVQPASKEGRSQPRQSRGQRGQQPTHGLPPSPTTASPVVADQPGVAFGITDSDLAALEEDEFQTVWEALGTVMRARAKARAKQAGHAQGQPDQDE